MDNYFLAGKAFTEVLVRVPTIPATWSCASDKLTEAGQLLNRPPADVKTNGAGEAK